MMEKILKGRPIVKGRAEGEALVTSECISFMGSTDPKTGYIIEHGHELEGECMKGKVLCFPSSKGSTGGSYMLYDAVKRGVGPSAIINVDAESIAVIGAIVADLPMVDHIDISQIKTGDFIKMDSESGEIEIIQKSHLNEGR
jgi:predicted aconitase with swiveling domain